MGHCQPRYFVFKYIKGTEKVKVEVVNEFYDTDGTTLLSRDVKLSEERWVPDPLRNLWIPRDDHLRPVDNHLSSNKSLEGYNLLGDDSLWRSLNLGQVNEFVFKYIEDAEVTVGCLVCIIQFCVNLDISWSLLYIFKDDFPMSLCLSILKMLKLRLKSSTSFTIQMAQVCYLVRRSCQKSMILVIQPPTWQESPTVYCSDNRSLRDIKVVLSVSYSSV